MKVLKTEKHTCRYFSQSEGTSRCCIAAFLTFVRLIHVFNYFFFSFVKLDPDRSLFDQGVKTDGTVQLSVQVISRQGKQWCLPLVQSN